MKRWLVALLTLLGARAARKASEREGDERIIPQGSTERRAENLVLALLAIAILWAGGFIATYDLFAAQRMPNELLGICLGLCLLCIATALIVISKRLVVTEEIEEEYPDENQQEQEEIAEIVHQSGSRFTRKRLLMGAGAATAGALGLAAATPALSLGPIWDTAPLDVTVWRRGRRLVDEFARPYRAEDIEQGSFYTAFPEDVDNENLSAPVVVVRLDPSVIHLPAGREGWAPEGILAYSKICTHAGCAIALYRKPTFPTVEPRPALVCPCHYSTFDPATGASVIFGPAGRPLPQLPLMVDSQGYLRAAGNYSQRIGPSWGSVRNPPS